MRSRIKSASKSKSDKKVMSLILAGALSMAITFPALYRADEDQGLADDIENITVDNDWAQEDHLESEIPVKRSAVESPEGINETKQVPEHLTEEGTADLPAEILEEPKGTTAPQTAEGKSFDFLTVNPLTEDSHTEGTLYNAPKKLLALNGSGPINYTESIQECAEALRSGMSNRQSTVTLYYHCEEKITEEGAGTAAKDLYNTLLATALEHTGIGNEGDYLRWQYASAGGTVKYDHVDETGTDVQIKYSLQYYTTAAQENQVTNMVSSVFSQLGVIKMSSEYEKTKAIYDYICDNIYYGSCGEAGEHPFTAFGAIVEGKAYCQGYAVLLYRMLLDAGVNSRVLTSTNHAWNIVQIDGAYYYADATWDAKINQQSAYSHKYSEFLKGRKSFEGAISAIGESHTPDSQSISLASCVNEADYKKNMPTSGIVGDNCAWAMVNGVMLVAPIDMEKRSVFDYTQSDAFVETTGEIECIVLDNISYVGPKVFTSMMYLQSIEFIGNVPAFEYVSSWKEYDGPLKNITYFWLKTEPLRVTVPCFWTEEEISRTGIYNNVYCEDPNIELNISHNYEKTTTGPTCTAAGAVAEKCVGCGKEKSSAAGAPAKGHAWVTISKIEPTCGKAGVEHQKCSSCDATRDVELAALEHSFNENLAKSKAATCIEDGYRYLECEHCKAVKQEKVPAKGHTREAIPDTETTSGGVRCSICREILEQPRTAISFSLEGVEAGTPVSVNGRTFTVDEHGKITVPVNMELSTAVIYSYNKADADRHQIYPVSMKVWLLTKDKSSVTARRTEFLDDLLIYSGTAIRLTGNQGICIKTRIPKGAWSSLTGSGYNGYTCLEYGTIVAWASDIQNDNLVHNGSGVIAAAKAYSRNGTYSPFSIDNQKVEYVNTLVFKDIAKTKPDLAIRPYMILLDSHGNQIILYGGVIYRSIGYIATQLKTNYATGTTGYEYIKKILDYCGSN